MNKMLLPAAAAVVFGTACAGPKSQSGPQVLAVPQPESNWSDMVPFGETCHITRRDFAPNTELSLDINPSINNVRVTVTGGKYRTADFRGNGQFKERIIGDYTPDEKASLAEIVPPAFELCQLWVNYRHGQSARPDASKPNEDFRKQGLPYSLRATATYDA